MKTEHMILGIIAIVAILGIVGYTQGWFEPTETEETIDPIIGGFSFRSTPTSDLMYWEFTTDTYSKMWQSQFDTNAEPWVLSYRKDTNNNDEDEFTMSKTIGNDDIYVNWDYTATDEYNRHTITMIDSTPGGGFPGTSFLLNYLGPVGYIEQYIITNPN